MSIRNPEHFEERWKCDGFQQKPPFPFPCSRAGRPSVLLSLQAFEGRCKYHSHIEYSSKFFLFFFFYRRARCGLIPKTSIKPKIRLVQDLTNRARHRFNMASPIAWTEIKALSFDIFGTLIDWENGIAQAARATSIGPYLPKDHKKLMLDIEKHDTTVQRENPTMRQSQIIAEGLRRYAKELRIVEDGHLTQDQVEQAAAEYGSKIGEYPAFPDTVKAIQSLGKRYKLIPLSNVDLESFSQTLAGPLKGIHFDKIYTAEDIGSYKPDIRNFHYLLEHVKLDFGLEKHQLCHVAQSLFHDHGPAKQVDLQSVWVDRAGFMGGNPENAQEKFGFELRVGTLQELADIVEEAWGRS